jgi:thiamine biosynthesis lipoprotein
MRLDLGGIAKGYAADQALAVLRDRGIPRALVDAGGDLAIGDPPPDARGWRIAVATPHSTSSPPSSPTPPPEDGAGTYGAESTVLLLSNCGVATSGDAYQFVEFEGRRYSHIVDPRTGMGVVGASSVTVVAPDGMTADALASAVSVLGPEEGIALIDRTPGAAALVVVLEDAKERQFQSRRMDEQPTE